MKRSENRRWFALVGAAAAAGFAASAIAQTSKERASSPASKSPVVTGADKAKPISKDALITTSNFIDPAMLAALPPRPEGLRGPGCAGCPGGGIPENEPNCGLSGGQPADTVNGGCNSTPNVFSPIAIGQTICGSGAFDAAAGFRDTDWYQITLATPTELTWTVTAEFEVLIGMIAAPCPATAFIAGTAQVSAACASISSVKCLTPGTYYLFVAPTFTSGVACGGGSDKYFASLTGVACTPPPPAGNDLCADATVLTIPSTTNSDNLSASGAAEAPACDPFARAVNNGVWFRFTGTGNIVQLATCGSGFDTVLNVYTGTCAALTCVGGNDDATAGPCSGTLQSYLEVQTTAGTQYYVCLSGYLGAQGSFTLTMSENLPTGACCNAGNCSITTQPACVGSWLGAGTGCTAAGLSRSVNVAITDNATISDSLTVASGPTITDLNVDLVISHTWQGDLIVTLTHVNTGTTTTLVDRPGQPQTTFGFSADNYGNPTTMAPFTLDDEAAQVYDTPQIAAPGTNNVSGSWKPDLGPLSVFDGQSLAGTWTLSISDNAGGDVGSLRYWALTPTPSLGGPCPTGPDCFTRNSGQQGGLWVRGGPNGVPDSTECVGDWDRNNSVAPADIASYVQTWLFSVSNPGNTYADVDCNNLVEPADVALFVQKWLAGLTPGGQGCP